MIHVISLGAGVQSSTIALMATAGEIQPKPNCAGFADTQAEPNNVYSWLNGYLIGLLNFPVYINTKGSLEEDSIRIRTSKKSGKRYMKGAIPAFVLKKDGKIGLLGRQCTADYKIGVMVKMERELIRQELSAWRKTHSSALKKLNLYKKNFATENRIPYPQEAWEECQADALVCLWIGISADEPERMKESREPWIKHRWPLIELNMSRQDCLNWMKKAGYLEPPRSACRFCPFHSNAEWQRLKEEDPADFEKSCLYEEKLQLAASQQEVLDGKPFLHSSCKPLREIDFLDIKKKQPAYYQTTLFGNECEGMCGV